MSRTKAWQKKMDELSAKEKSLRKDLEFDSTKLEKRGLIVLGIAGIVAIAIIGAFSIIPKKKKSKTENQNEKNSSPIKTKSESKGRMGAFITEKIITSLITLLISNFQKQNSANEKPTDN